MVKDRPSDEIIQGKGGVEDDGRWSVEDAETEVELTTHPMDSLNPEPERSKDKLEPRDNWADKATVSAVHQIPGGWQDGREVEV